MRHRGRAFDWLLCAKVEVIEPRDIILNLVHVFIHVLVLFIVVGLQLIRAKRLAVGFDHPLLRVVCQLE